MFSCARIASLLAITGLALGARAQSSVTVDTLEDTVDIPAGATMADLPGPDGRVSMREAVLVTNNEPGPQTINFGIPQSEFWLVDGMALLRLEDGPFVITDDGTTIDFSTQATNIGDTNPDGMEVGVYGLQANGWGSPAISVFAENTTIKGLGMVHLREPAVQIFTNNNRVIGCTTSEIIIDAGWQQPPSSFNVIGGTEPGEGNDLEAVEILSWADDNIVIGNRIDTVRIEGSPYSVNPQRNRIGGPTDAERNVINGFGRFGSEGFPTGQGIVNRFADGTVIQNNYIGVDETGTQRVASPGPTGIQIADCDNIFIKDNLVAGLKVEGRNHANGLTFGQAIHIAAINAPTTNVRLEGNIVGADATGQNPITTYQGIIVSPYTSRHLPSNVTIGGLGAGQANRVAFCELAGIAVSSLVEHVEISGNSIEANGLLGIDLLNPTGPNANDPGDADGGANNGQNYPVITKADIVAGQLELTGTLNSTPLSSFRIELFASDACDDSGFGEGGLFLGSVGVTTDAAGDATFDASFPASGLTTMAVVTATATTTGAFAAVGDTSEFSPCRSVVVTRGCAADTNNDGTLTPADFFAWVAAFNTADSECDQNFDNLCNVGDFFAWVANYNAGCD